MAAAARTHPLVAAFLLRSARRDPGEGGDDNDDPPDGDRGRLAFPEVVEALSGLRVWEATLRKARLPLDEDFRGRERPTWPEDPLFERVCEALSELGLPRLVRRHPEITASVLLGVAKAAVRFMQAQRRGKLVVAEDPTEDEEEERAEDIDADPGEGTRFEYEPLTSEEEAQLADSLADGLRQEWGGAARGAAVLDGVFGYDHGLLDPQVRRRRCRPSAPTRQCARGGEDVGHVGTAASGDVKRQRHQSRLRWVGRSPRKCGRLPHGTRKSTLALRGGRNASISWASAAHLSLLDDTAGYVIGPAAAGRFCASFRMTDSPAFWKNAASLETDYETTRGPRGPVLTTSPLLCLFHGHGPLRRVVYMGLNVAACGRSRRSAGVTL